MIRILIFVLIFLLPIIFAYQSYQFNVDDIWKIEEQRREHLIWLPFLGKVLHNKGSYFAIIILENYLSFYSPSIFYCCDNSPITGSILLVTFYFGTYLILKSNFKGVNLIVAWILIYPIFPSLMLLSTSYLLLAPLIIPTAFYTFFLLVRYKLYDRHR